MWLILMILWQNPSLPTFPPTEKSIPVVVVSTSGTIVLPHGK